LLKEDASAIQAQKAASTPAAGGNADEEGPEDWPEYSEDLKDQMLKHAGSLLEDGYSTEDVVWLHAAYVFLEALVDEVQLQIWIYEEEVKHYQFLDYAKRSGFRLWLQQPESPGKFCHIISCPCNYKRADTSAELWHFMAGFSEDGLKEHGMNIDELQNQERSRIMNAIAQEPILQPEEDEEFDSEALGAIKQYHRDMRRAIAASNNDTAEEMWSYLCLLDYFYDEHRRLLASSWLILAPPPEAPLKGLQRPLKGPQRPSKGFQRPLKAL
jgi:hypothetical protein